MAGCGAFEGGGESKLRQAGATALFISQIENPAREFCRVEVGWVDIIAARRTPNICALADRSWTWLAGQRLRAQELAANATLNRRP